MRKSIKAQSVCRETTYVNKSTAQGSLISVARSENRSCHEILTGSRRQLAIYIASIVCAKSPNLDIYQVDFPLGTGAVAA
jgi:hypothetical protein